MSDNSNFFNKQTLSSRIKASIVSEYFPQYCGIITKKHTPAQIGYFDMFAGPGIYKDGNISTPILIGQKCLDDSMLKNRVWMIFNDMTFKDELERNFKAFFPSGTFNQQPLFGNVIFGEYQKTNKFLTRNTYVNKKNECPSILFIDPWGYKHINTPILVKFLGSWGNEVFIFINTKRLNADIEKEISQENIQTIFPTTYLQLRNEKKLQSSVEQRHKFIVDCIAQEFRAEYNHIYCTAFEFMEEDQSSPSHYLLHITKSPRGFELIKLIYDKYANVHRSFNSSYVTYTYDPKKNPCMVLFDEQFKQDKIEFLKQQIKTEYTGKTISARQLFKEHQKNCLYAEKHYRLALRQLSDEGDLVVTYTDLSKHRVSVKLEDYCILTFK